jgi:transposase
MLIEAAWSYRFPPRIAREQPLRQERLANPIRDIAWKAQERLCRRYRKLARAGKLPTGHCHGNQVWPYPRRPARLAA